MRKYLIVILLLMSMCVSQAQSTGDWQIIDTLWLREMVGSNSALTTASISPDASKLVWANEYDDAKTEICMYIIADESTVCSEPHNVTRIESLANWSADSRYIVFTEVLFPFFLDTDIHIFDSETLEFQNITRDEARLIYDEGAIVDFVPRWHPVTGDIYFLRTEDSGDGVYSLEWMHVPFSEGEAGDIEQVLDLVPLRNFDSQVTVYNVPPVSLDGGISFSPDGNTVAFIERDIAHDSPDIVRFLDVESGEVLSTMRAENFVFLGMPLDLMETMTVGSLDWVDNESVILTSVDSLNPDAVNMVGVFQLSIDGERRALIDFSDRTYEDDLRNMPYNVPFSSVLIAETDQFLYFNLAESVSPEPAFRVSILSVNNPDAGVAHLSLEIDPDAVHFPFNRASIGRDGNVVRVVFADHLITLSAE